jgi:hypothetical protein
MQVIQHQELASAQASITFSSIPQTFTDLVLVTSLRSNRGSPSTEDSVKIEFNTITSGYSGRFLRGEGSGTNSSSFSDAFILLNQNAGGTTANTFSSASLYIPNYTSSSNKSLSVDIVQENNSSDSRLLIVSALWSNTAAITSLTLTPNVGTALVQFSSATLYGITKGSDGIVTVS